MVLLKSKTRHDTEKWAKVAEKGNSAITSNCQNFYFLPQLTFLKVYFLIGHVAIMPNNMI